MKGGGGTVSILQGAPSSFTFFFLKGLEDASSQRNCQVVIFVLITTLSWRNLMINRNDGAYVLPA